MAASAAPLVLPDHIGPAFCQELAARLDAATREAVPAGLPATLPQPAALALLKRCTHALSREHAVVHVKPPPGAEVVVVGDLHGQFHDLLRLLELAGSPCDQRLYIFDGDFVDRGAWGLEIVLLLAAWKLGAPHGVWLVRGNHESNWVYGFRAELLAKYGSGAGGEAVFNACLKLFAALPLAAVVAQTTLVLHGGLPRAPPRRATRRSLPSEVKVASLADIAASGKGGEDPDPAEPEQRLAADVLWSDPSSEPGIVEGSRPGGVGILFGPDVTAAFLRDNGLRCILRGHEGKGAARPDARVLRPAMQPMTAGYTLDHDTPAGRLYTVFSAPLYPQFGAQRFDNLGAVAVLEGPGYSQPRFLQFAAAQRPEAKPYYEEPQAEEGGVEEAAAGAPPAAAAAAPAAEPAAAGAPVAEPAAPAAPSAAAAAPVAAAAPAEEPGGKADAPTSPASSGQQGGSSGHAAAGATVVQREDFAGAATAAAGVAAPEPPLGSSLEGDAAGAGGSSGSQEALASGGCEPAADQPAAKRHKADGEPAAPGVASEAVACTVVA